MATSDLSKINDTINNSIKNALKELKYCYLTDAKVTAVATDGTLTIKKKGYENTDQSYSNIKNYSGLTITVGDRVSIITVNNNESDMRVWQKIN